MLLFRNPCLKKKKTKVNTKEKIASILNSSLHADNEMEFISGEELAKRCNVSRAAVHKAICALREEGFCIEAVTNKGYSLKSFPDRLDSSLIEDLVAQRIGQANNFSSKAVQVFAFKEIDSTNLEAKRRTADKELHRVVFAAEKQTAGRGRLGRVFVSPADSGVYFSLVYRPAGGVKNPAFLTAAAAVAVSRAVKQLYNWECKIKWVNDVFLEGKKISGILTEGVANFETGTIDSALVGIGINVRNCGFEGKLAEVAGSIEEIIAENMDKQKKSSENLPKVSRNQLVAVVVSELLNIYDSYFCGDKKEVKNAMDEYRARSLLTGMEVFVNPVAGLEGKVYRAKVLDVTDEAELLVQTEDGTTKKLFSGEVSLKSENFAG